jgi:hypothetical protein
MGARPRGLAYYDARGVLPTMGMGAPMGLPPAKGLSYFTGHSALGDVATPADVAQAAPATQFADAALQDKIMDGVAPGPEQGGSPNVPSPAAPPPVEEEKKHGLGTLLAVALAGAVGYHLFVKKPEPRANISTNQRKQLEALLTDDAARRKKLSRKAKKSK